MRVKLLYYIQVSFYAVKKLFLKVFKGLNGFF